MPTAITSINFNRGARNRSNAVYGRKHRQRERSSTVETKSQGYLTKLQQDATDFFGRYRELDGDLSIS